MNEATEQRTVTSADLLAELRDEQKSFRFLMRVLAMIVVVAMIVVGTTVVYFFWQLSSSMQELRAYNSYKDNISRAEFARQRETNREELVILREEVEAWQRYADVNEFVQQKHPEEHITQEHVDDAIIAARRNFTEEPLNEVTTNLLRVVLTAAADQKVRLDQDDRLLLEIALEDSTNENPDDLIDMIQNLQKSVRTERFLGFADAALTELYYKKANANTMKWELGCEQAVRHADLAVAAGFRYPQILLRKGDCLRKHGEVERAYLAFDEAASWLDNQYEDRKSEEPLYLSRLVHHGIGTTLLAMAASDKLPINLSQQDALAKAEHELTEAADRRVRRGATPVGRAYTMENVGFIYIMNEEWDKALSHTAEVDRVIPLAWNLTVRHIAALKKREQLEAEDGPRAEIDDMKRIERETEGVLGLMDCPRIYASELPKLLPEVYGPVIRKLTGRCTGEAG